MTFHVLVGKDVPHTNDGICRFDVHLSVDELRLYDPGSDKVSQIYIYYELLQKCLLKV